MIYFFSVRISCSSKTLVSFQMCLIICVLNPMAEVSHAIKQARLLALPYPWFIGDVHGKVTMM